MTIVVKNSGSKYIYTFFTQTLSIVSINIYRVVFTLFVKVKHEFEIRNLAEGFKLNSFLKI